MNVRDEQQMKRIRFELRLALDGMTGCFTELTLSVIRYRFGLDTGQSHTYRDTAHVFNRSPERIRQIEAKFLRRLHTLFGLHTGWPGQVVDDARWSNGQYAP